MQYKRDYVGHLVPTIAELMRTERFTQWWFNYLIIYIVNEVIDSTMGNETVVCSNPSASIRIVGILTGESMATCH